MEPALLCSTCSSEKHQLNQSFSTIWHSNRYKIHPTDRHAGIKMQKEYWISVEVPSRHATRGLEGKLWITLNMENLKPLTWRSCPLANILSLFYRIFLYIQCLCFLSLGFLSLGLVFRVTEDILFSSRIDQSDAYQWEIRQVDNLSWNSEINLLPVILKRRLISCK